ncbi:PREDICTED: uncharacterized protein LOC105148972 isoform X1 [Acromyrmex echinatior]|uniref:uncharacterized protein LOC105148972 isoform X1 n=2 Tax=Acromyrmex echinatior TaxID=103372 RepID=UPI000580D632|nr:PREDICTED: uncharacterized protein LOC105148972 isoform X1 [Acromyrmex echinatior]XP_011059365.1 PREDICTED: uncharacterized protein LOC105148972 isoform X1 [Acromyrmex echinatior]XP_011059366.1 PREDICTED: uncharacterized protein LOC105148972 isoform X1 [Acromyrmex echinatior]XP_011059367.1 PREDICTED: uncharacterized protein LOC105148972 isoform X1 [Acromyrmex echinatior]XP_011059368.1 PREDICTED: uncharacterized protein LOC105148972 isoform X1 [Acromyrmex echinatior]
MGRNYGRHGRYLTLCSKRLSKKKKFVLRRRRKREMMEQAALAANYIANNIIKSESIESIDSFISPEAMESNSFMSSEVMDSKEMNTLETNLGTKPMNSKEINTLETYLETRPMNSKEINTLETYQDISPMNSNEINTLETYLETRPMNSKIMNTLETYLDTKLNKDIYENVRICEEDDIPGINRIQEHEPEGDRIINISFFMKEMHRVFDGHAPGFECKFKDWILINSRRRGLLTQFFYKCQTCSYEANFWSHPTDKKVFLISTAITASNQNSKIGINAELKEQFAAVNLPCLNGKIDIR